LSRPLELEIAGTDCERFTDPGAGIVEEKQESPIATTRWLLAIDDCNHGTHVLGLEIGDESARCTLRRNTQDSAILLGARDVVTQKVLGEATDRGESTIASHRAVASLGLDVVKELEHRVGAYVIKLKVGDGAAASIAEEHKEHFQRVAIGANGVLAGPANPSKVIRKEALNEFEERVGRRPGHDERCPFEYRR
jgi:hypothetical protein